jgi:hypothetical protein
VGTKCRHQCRWRPRNRGAAQRFGSARRQLPVPRVQSSWGPSTSGTTRAEMRARVAPSQQSETVRRRRVPEDRRVARGHPKAQPGQRRPEVALLRGSVPAGSPASVSGRLRYGLAPPSV